MKDKEIPDRWVTFISNAATLLGIALGFYVLASEVKDSPNSSVGLALFGLFVGYLSAFKLFSDMLDFFGEWKTQKARRWLGGFMVLLIVVSSFLVAGTFGII
ncbi:MULTISPECIES: hypothetical protein [unclassified Aureimonas]|uniref:hypothetical protein n=1 Tax=unclassified Aureimonas TaxID=2615206 RepID=UPI0012E3D6AA|nr:MULTISPECIES: hypothetical protein [unclassified Aureimonas]